MSFVYYRLQIVKEHRYLVASGKCQSKDIEGCLCCAIVIAQHQNGGATRDRTADLLRARQALSQLSYSPSNWWVWVDLNHRPHPYQGCALTN